MAELDPASQVLASYRAARRASPELRDAMRDRLARDLAAQRHAAHTGATRRGRAIVVVAAALALAAAMVLLWQSFGRPQALASTIDHEQASDRRLDRSIAAPTTAPSAAPVPAELPRAELPLTEAMPQTASPPSPDTPAPAAARERGREAPASSTLAAELAGLEAIRALLEEHHADEALAALAEHRVAFPTGQLTREREALTIEALCRSGDHTSAQLRAHGFARTYPGSTALAKLPPECR